MSSLADTTLTSKQSPVIFRYRCFLIDQIFSHGNGTGNCSDCGKRRWLWGPDLAAMGSFVRPCQINQATVALAVTGQAMAVLWDTGLGRVPSLWWKWHCFMEIRATHNSHPSGTLTYSIPNKHRTVTEQLLLFYPTY